MVKYVTVEMKVDNVGEMSKTGPKCVLKGEAVINGIEAEFSLTIVSSKKDLFYEMRIDNPFQGIDMVLQDPAQTKLVEGDA